MPSSWRLWAWADSSRKQTNGKERDRRLDGPFFRGYHKGMNKESIIVIGAGPAGLTAAIELLKRGYAVTVLEASDRIGGISQTVRYAGNRMDIGGHRFFSKDDRVNAWWAERMPLQGAPAWDDKQLNAQKDFVPGGPDPEREDRVMLLRDRVSRIYFHRHFFDYPISLKWSTIRNMGFFTTLRAGFSYLYSCVHKLPETSLENFYINRFGRVLYSMFFESYTEKVWGRHPAKISADWGAQRVKGLSVRAILKDIFRKLFGGGGEVETSLIERFYYPKYGPGQLWELAAEEVKTRGGEIKMNCPVVGLKAGEGRIQTVRFLENGVERALSAQAVFSSMPVRELVSCLQGVPVPEQVKASADTLPYRDFVTVGLLAQRLLIQNDTRRPTVHDRVPDCWIYVQDRDVKLGRVQIFNNWSPYMVADPENRVWMGLEYFCDEGDDFWRLSDEALIALAKREIEKIGIARGDAILDAHVERIRKAYPAYFDGYAGMDGIIRFLDGFENLYCIGRNGQHRYNNMDHSMATAFEAVSILAGGEKDKTALWQVNTEQAYHEQK